MRICGKLTQLSKENNRRLNRWVLNKLCRASQVVISSWKKKISSLELLGNQFLRLRINQANNFICELLLAACWIKPEQKIDHRRLRIKKWGTRPLCCKTHFSTAIPVQANTDQWICHISSLQKRSRVQNSRKLRVECLKKRLKKLR